MVSTAVSCLRGVVGDVVCCCCDDDGGVEVAIEGLSAGVAVVRPLGQRQLGFHCAADRAGFGAGQEAVDDVQGRAVPAGLVGELPAELAEPGIEDGPVEAGLLADAATRLFKSAAGGSSHAGDVQVFDGDADVLGGQGLGDLVERAGALLGDLVMEPADPADRFDAAC